jgi:hypothetical protein
MLERLIYFKDKINIVLTKANNLSNSEKRELNITYLTGEWPARASSRLCQDPTKISTVYNCRVLLRTIIENCNTLFYLESTATSCLYVRALCPALLQRLQRY